MKKLCLFIAISAGGSLGWWLGAFLGTMTAYFLGVVGSLAGVVVGCLFNRRYLD